MAARGSKSSQNLKHRGASTKSVPLDNLTWTRWAIGLLGPVIGFLRPNSGGAAVGRAAWRRVSLHVCSAFSSSITPTTLGHAGPRWAKCSSGRGGMARPPAPLKHCSSRTRHGPSWSLCGAPVSRVRWWGCRLTCMYHVRCTASSVALDTIQGTSRCWCGTPSTAINR